MAEKEAIMRALQEAMGGSASAPAKSQRPRIRPPGFGAGGLSDKMKKNALQKIMQKGAMTQGGTLENSMMNMSPEQIKMLEQLMKQQQMKQGAAERKAFPPPSMMNNGGAVRKRKPKKGCVMKGRGGKYKGIK